MAIHKNIKQTPKESNQNTNSISPEAKVQATKAKARGQDTFTESISRWPLTLTHILCWLRLGQAEHALYDANVCRELKLDCSKRCCFREGVALCFLQRFVEAANAFLRRSKAKRSVMSSEVVDAQKEVSRQGKD
ncbi:hypothetical protein YC2023_057954 [Brassica napus]